MTTEQMIMHNLLLGRLSQEDAHAIIRTLHEIRFIKVTYVRNRAA